MHKQNQFTKLKRLRWAAFLFALIPGIGVLCFAVVILLFGEDSFEDLETYELALYIALVPGIPFLLLAGLTWFWPKVATIFALVVAAFYLYGTIDPPISDIWLFLPLAFVFLVVAVLNIGVWRTKRRFA